MWNINKRKTLILKIKGNQMKYNWLFFLFLSVMIFIQGCMASAEDEESADVYYYYHNTPKSPYFIKATKTIYRLMNDERNKNQFDFGILAARDNDTLSYFLFAPSRSGYSVTELSDVNVYLAMPLFPAQAWEFSKILTFCAEKWNVKFNNREGIYYELITITPTEYNIFIGDREDTITTNKWYPKLTFDFKNTSSGSYALITYGNNRITYTYKLEKLSQIRDLIRMLDLKNLK